MARSKKKTIAALEAKLDEQKRDVISKALVHLKDTAGKLQSVVGSLEWKSSLPEEVAWSHIVTEIGYKFWKNGDAIERLDKAFEASDRAWQAYTKCCQVEGMEVDAEVEKQMKETHDKAKVLNTEEYFVRVIEEKQDGMVRKLSRRQVQFTRNNDIDEVHEVIRKRVSQETGL